MNNKEDFIKYEIGNEKETFSQVKTFDLDGFTQINIEDRIEVESIVIDPDLKKIMISYTEH